MYSYIAIEGVIGAGKTTYAKFLADKLGYNLVLEEFDDNAFLPKFYQEPEKYAFPLELSFLASRYHQIQREIENRDLFKPNIVSDFVLYKSLVFASVTLKKDELELYRKLFDIIFKSLPIPDLTIYIHQPMDTIVSNIEKRNRSYEQDIPEDYLTKLQNTYMKFFQQLPQHRIVILELNGQDIYTDKMLQNALLTISQKKWEKGIHTINLTEHHEF